MPENGQNRVTSTTCLAWGVKESFRAYVEGAGGTITANASARSERAGLVFPLSKSSPLEASSIQGALPTEGELRFEGEVRFEAHGGFLSVAIIDPWIVFAPTEAALTVVDTDYPDRSKRLKIARLDPTEVAFDPTGTRFEAPAALTMQGSQLLGDVYPARTALDPVIVEMLPAEEVPAR